MYFQNPQNKLNGYHDSLPQNSVCAYAIILNLKKKKNFPVAYCIEG